MLDLRTGMMRSLMIAAALLMTACAASPSAQSSDLPYFTSLPSKQTLEEQYRRIEHDLSPFEEYHVRMTIPADWQVTDRALSYHPVKDELAEIALVREPGEWMQDQSAQPRAEISVNVVNVQGSAQWPSIWLEKMLKKSTPGHEVLEKRTVSTRYGDAADLLVRYDFDGQKHIARMIAFRQNDDLFVITGSDTQNGYRDTAEALYTAVATADLVSAPGSNPFKE